MIPDSLFSPSQSPVSVLLRFPFLLPQSPVSSPSQSPLPSSFVLFPILSDSRFDLLKVLFPPLQILFQSSSNLRSIPLPSSSEPKKTAERHEAVPPFLVVVRSKMEHDSFISRSSIVCSRTACTLRSGCVFSPTASRSWSKCNGSLQCQARSDCTSSSKRMKIPCLPLFFI